MWFFNDCILETPCCIRVNVAFFVFVVENQVKPNMIDYNYAGKIYLILYLYNLIFFKTKLYYRFKIAHPPICWTNAIPHHNSPISPQMTLMSFCLSRVWTLPSETTTYKTTFAPALLTIFTLTFSCVISLWNWSPRSLQDFNQVTAWELTGVCYVLQIKLLVLNSPDLATRGVPLGFPLRALTVSKKDLCTSVLLSNNVSMLYVQ